MIAERYLNTIYVPTPHEVVRFWVSPRVLVGGTILDGADYDHLARDFGITHVISCETEHDDDGKVPPERLWYARWPDTGEPPPWTRLKDACQFARWMPPKSRFYVHCQGGRYRSPSLAWAVAVDIGDAEPDVALSVIQSELPHFAREPDRTVAYLNAARRAIA